MSRPLLRRALLATIFCCAFPAIVQAQASERQIVIEARHVLQEIMAIPVQGIPRALLADAQGLVVVPGMIRGGFIVGVKHGRGIAVARNSDGTWTNPVFVRITGGNIGFQAGLQATDLVLVFRNQTRVEELMRGRFTIGASASAAAGPVGRDMSAATDAQLRSEILSYSRSRGLFAGVAIDGAVMQPDPNATAIFYGQTPTHPQGHVPAVATQFVSLLTAHSTGNVNTVVPVPHTDHELVCRELLAAHERLAEILDPAWQQHLALPANVTSPTPEAQASLRATLARYNQVASDPQFRALAERQEFQETLTMLNRHARLQEAAAANVLPLPPPPQ
ncbi:MAG: lipid-binding SYLF domain-containing protein [Pirellulales bacterium]|nr:lipid-binding SYLF domain-containing protein [Pirellulales bacterium]